LLKLKQRRQLTKGEMHTTVKYKAREEHLCTKEAWGTTKAKHKTANRGSEKLEEAWETTKEAATEGAEKADEVWERAKENRGRQAKSTWKKSKEAVEEGAEKAEDAWEIVKDRASEAWEIVKEVSEKASDAWETVKDASEEAWGDQGHHKCRNQEGRRAVGGHKGESTRAKTKGAEKVDEAFEKAKEAKLKENAGDVWEKMKKTVSEVKEEVEKKSVFSKAKKAVGNLFGSAKDE
jgi:hypothetical protein